MAYCANYKGKKSPLLPFLHIFHRLHASNIIKLGQELDPLQNGYLAAELERAGGKKRGNLVRSDFAEWLFPSERLHQKTSLRMIPSPVTLVDLQQIHIEEKQKGHF